MIDTSPWSSCSRQSPWLHCSCHTISSTGPSVSPFRYLFKRKHLYFSQFQTKTSDSILKRLKITSILQPMHCNGYSSEKCDYFCVFGRKTERAGPKKSTPVAIFWMYHGVYFSFIEVFHGLVVPWQREKQKLSKELMR